MKASASSLCNKYCKAHLVSFFLSFFQVKYNNQCPKPCFQHSKEKSCCYQHNTSSQSKKKTVSTSWPIKILFQFKQPINLFTFLKSDLNKAPELGELPGKPYTEAQIKKKKKKRKGVRNKNKRFQLVKI